MLDRQQLKNSRFFIVYLSGLVALAPLSLDMYMPAMADMATFFGVPFAAVNLTMSAYLFGNALGQFFGGSLSDQLGRRKVGVSGLGIFFIATVFILFTDDIKTLQWLRVVQAIGGGFCMVICIAQVRDIFPEHEVMKRYANVILVMLIAPIVAPSVGALLMQLGWQAIFILLAVYSFGMFITYLLVLPETRSQVRTRVNVGELFAGYWQVVNHRVNGRLTGIRYALYSGFCSGVFMCLLTNAAMIFMNHYGLSEVTFAIGFAGVGIAMIIGNRLSVKMADQMPPETWLRTATLTQIVCISTLIVLSVSGALSARIVASLVFLIMIMSGSIMPTAAGRYITFFDELAGSAASLSTTLSFSLGAIVGAIAALLSGDSITPVFVTMGASALIALAILLTIDTTRTVPEAKSV